MIRHYTSGPLCSKTVLLAYLYVSLMAGGHPLWPWDIIRKPVGRPAQPVSSVIRPGGRGEGPNLPLLPRLPFDLGHIAADDDTYH